MRKPIMLLLVAGLFLYSFNSCNNTLTADPASPGSTDNKATEDPVKKGEYLVTIMGCNDCHSPKRMGPNGPEIIPELKLGGFPATAQIPPSDAMAVKNGWVTLWADLTTAVGPWGQTYAANITSDTTGIGAWTAAQFKKALTEGKYKGLDNSRPLLPPMPWQNFRQLKDEDLNAIFAYLKSTKPVNNVVPAAKLNPPPSKI